MNLRLKERSLVDVVFASYSCRASDPIVDRDKEADESVKQQLGTNGDVQDMLTFIAGKPKVCLVALDYAGLSTNCADIYKFLCNYPQIKRITVDLLPNSLKATPD